MKDILITVLLGIFAFLSGYFDFLLFDIIFIGLFIERLYNLYSIIKFKIKHGKRN